MAKFGLTLKKLVLGLFALPIISLSMGGCPPPEGNGNGNDNGDAVIDVTINPPGSGTVSQQADGNMVTLTATANEGFAFDGWSGVNFEPTSENPITVDANNIDAIQANFISTGNGCDENSDCPEGEVCQDGECVEEEPPPSPLDRDNDGVADVVDQCPNTPASARPVDGNGCAASERDSDGDGVIDSEDDCPRTPENVNVDNQGCPVSVPGTPDDDDDGVPNDIDQCENTPAGADVDANGCAESQRDIDNDGVNDDRDDCDSTPAGATVDPATGCAASELDSDSDGVTNDKDQCPGTPLRTPVDANGCPTGGGGGGPPPPICGNGIIESGEQCDDSNTTSGDGCSSTCQAEAGGPVCGNGTREGNEQCDDGNASNNDACVNCNDARCGDGFVRTGVEECDDGNTSNVDACVANCQNAECGDGFLRAGVEQCDDSNTTNGDGCSSTCTTEGGSGNDSCANPVTVSDGTTPFSNATATTDGPDEGTPCLFFSNSQINNDIWFCYTATCTGEAIFSLCGSDYDTKLAVYSGCGCPEVSAIPLGCNDDGCGSGVERVESRVTANVVSGQQYMVRVGGYQAARGDGRLTIRCGADTCAQATGDCFSANPNNAPGCGDPTCCQETCALDQFCCDVSWDQFCAGEASGVCTGSFSACAAGSGSCNSADSTPGCDNVDCCNTVCAVDPFCCLTTWDQNCVDEAQSACFLSCNSRAGDCFTAHATRGCNSLSCCQRICPDDAFCCETEWDQECVNQANTLCR